MKINKACILILNGGSSTIKFALYAADKSLARLFQGKIDRIGSKDSILNYILKENNQKYTLPIKAFDNKSASISLIDWLEKQVDFSSVKAVAHRIVHGMRHTEPQYITPESLDELRLIIPYDPDNLPNEIELIDTFRQRYQTLQQVACFDTAFHTSMGFTPAG